jgi:hypothetical protein
MKNKQPSKTLVKKLAIMAVVAIGVAVFMAFDLDRFLSRSASVEKDDK